jgi:hypothetical protein
MPKTKGSRLAMCNEAPGSQLNKAYHRDPPDPSSPPKTVDDFVAYAARKTRGLGGVRSGGKRLFFHSRNSPNA